MSTLIDSLPHKADINRQAYSQATDDLGAEIPVDAAPYAENEPAWFQVLSANSVNAYRARNQTVTHACYLQRNPGLTLGDRIVAKNGDDADCPYAGDEFEFVVFHEASAGAGILWKAIVKIVQEPA